MSQSIATPDGKRPRPWGLRATLGFCFAALVVLLIIQTGVAILFLLGELPHLQTDPNRITNVLWTNGVYLGVAGITSIPAATALLVLFARLRRGYPVRDYLGLRKVTKGQLLRWLALTAILMLCSDALTLLLRRPLVPPVMVNFYRTPGAAPFLHIAVLLAAPVCEEISFRGFLFEGIRYSRLGPAGAVVVSALFWSALHFQYDAYGIVTVFLFGILLGAARLKTNSTYPTIVMHFLNNLVATSEVLWLLHR